MKSSYLSTFYLNVKEPSRSMIRRWVFSSQKSNRQSSSTQSLMPHGNKQAYDSPRQCKTLLRNGSKEKLANGTLEFSQGPYRSRYFLVPKKNLGEYRMINDVQPLNKVTIRDAGMPPSVDEFSEEFAGYPVLTSVDYYSGYDQMMLDRRSRDLTAFQTDAGLVRQTRLPQVWTNSVACFQRAIVKVHWKQIPKHARPFLDDVGLHSPKSRYNDIEISPGVRKFVWEHAQIFRQFMRDVWSSGMTISGRKTIA